MLKTIPVFILLFTGYLCNAQTDYTTVFWKILTTATKHETTQYSVSPFHLSPGNETQESDPVPERSLPALVMAGVSIALVLLCTLIVAIFWYAWKKSQEGSMELNPIPYGEAGVSFRNPSVPESQQEWPSERAVP
ncbi:uncharacterized protein FYW23_003047 isoform 2-T2 [Sylvia borin]